jgi:membrane peptidoglycan carboxypeptidase
VRAIVRRLVSGRREGASTIQQKLVRVTTGRYEISLVRKVREMVFALALGRLFTRRQMVGLYLSHGYYGHSMLGVRAACAHLQIDRRGANLKEAAEVVARLRHPQPSKPSPEYQARIDQRVRRILNRADALGRGTRPNIGLQPTAAGAILSRRG